MTAGRPDSAEGKYIHSDGPLPEYAEQLQAIKAALAAANAANDGSMEARHGVALLHEQFWTAQELVSMDCGYFDDATKASREAARHGELAVKLSRSTLADRVLLLERTLVSGVRKGRGIAEAAKKRKRAQD